MPTGLPTIRAAPARDKWVEIARFQPENGNLDPLIIGEPNAGAPLQPAGLYPDPQGSAQVVGLYPSPPDSLAWSASV
jgi:hypothetical protein